MMMELTLVLLELPISTASHMTFGQFNVPFRRLESRAMLLMPEDAFRTIFTDDAIVNETLDPRRTAMVSIPYFPDPDDKSMFYSFDLFVAYLSPDVPALAEMAFLNRYAPRIYDRYSHLAEEFEL